MHGGREEKRRKGKSNILRLPKPLEVVGIPDAQVLLLCDQLWVHLYFETKALN